MTLLAFVLVALALLTVAALTLAAAAFFQAQAATRALHRRERQGTLEGAVEIQDCRTQLEGLAAQLHDLQQMPPQSVVMQAPRPGLNLAKRTQALRLNRHGNSATEIAAQLELPIQEVQLLLKVHEIVIRNV